MAEPGDFGNALLTWTSSTAERYKIKNRLNYKSKKVSHNKNSQQFYTTLKLLITSHMGLIIIYTL